MAPLSTYLNRKGVSKERDERDELEEEKPRGLPDEDDFASSQLDLDATALVGLHLIFLWNI